MQYNAAYYGAISALERWALAASYAGPGFDGESGRSWGNNTWHRSDERFERFYTYGNGNDTLLWNVKSKTDRIPLTWEGNIEADFWTGNNDSKEYNSLNYNTAEIIPLGALDPSAIATGNYYKTGQADYKLNQVEDIQVSLRFNPLLKNSFSQEGANKWILDPNIAKTPLVNWTIKGEFTKDKVNPQSNREDFSIIPYESRTASKIRDNDTLIRGKQLEGGNTTLTFGQNKDIFGGDNSTINLISSQDEAPDNYKTFFGKTKNMKLTLDLINLVKTQRGNIYPFLEYQVQSTGSTLSDRYFTIIGEGKVGNYHIKLQVKKPVLDQPALWNFTILF